MIRRALALVITLALLVGVSKPGFSQTGPISSGGGGGGAISSNACATADAILKQTSAAGTALDCSSWTDASNLLTSTTATGVGLGTATPFTVATENISSTGNKILQVKGGSGYGILAATGDTGGIVDFANSAGSRLRLLVAGANLTLARLDTSGATQSTYMTTSGDAITLGSATAGGLTASWGTGGGISLTDSANGKALGIKQLTELTTIAAAATTSTTIQIPANSLVIAVTVRVTTVIPTATTFDIGVTGATTRYGTGIAVAAGTTNSSPGTTNPTIYGSAVSILFTPNLTPADTTGRVRTTIYYIDATAPTS